MHFSYKTSHHPEITTVTILGVGGPVYDLYPDLEHVFENVVFSLILVSEQGGLVGLVDYPDDDEDDDEDEDKEDTVPLSKKAKFES